MWSLQALAFASGPVLLWDVDITRGGTGSTAALAVDLCQSATFEAQILIHAVVRAIDPLFDGHLLTPVRAAQVTDQAACGRFAALLLHFELSVPGADQLAATAQGVSLRLTRQSSHH